MLRLQPSEIGLTSNDIHTFKRRLQARRHARVQVLNGELFGSQQCHPRVHRGPARSRDEALTDPLQPLTSSRMVHETSDSFPIADDVQDQVNQNQDGVDRSSELNQDSWGDLPAATSASEEQELLSDQNLPYQETISRSQQRDEQGQPNHSEGSTLRSRPPYPKSLSHGSDGCDRYLEYAQGHDERRSSDLFTQLDGLDARYRRDGTAEQRRRFRPRSQSDPHDVMEGPGLVQPRRRPPPLHSEYHAIFPVIEGHGDSERLSNECFAFLGSRNQGGTSIESSAASLFRTPVPAAYTALRNYPSPLDRIAGAFTTLDRTGEEWRMALPFRFPALPSPGRLQAYTTTLPSAVSSREQNDVGDAAPSFASPHPQISLLDGAQEQEPHTQNSLDPQRTETRSLLQPVPATTSSPTRTTLCRRNAIHRSRSSVDSIPDEFSRDTNPITRVIQSRSRSRSRSTRPSPRSPRPGRVHDADRLQVSEHALQSQQARFFRALAQANGGCLPSDAGRRWMQFLEHLASAHSESEEELAAALPTYRHVSPGRNSTGDEEPAVVPLQAVDDSQHPGLQFAVRRGGRPIIQAPSVPRHAIPRRPVPPLGRNSSEQENLPDETLQRFDEERRERLRRIQFRVRHGDMSGYGADDESNDDDATPPPTGRFERFLG